MSFNADEISIEGGRPAWLYEFRLGSTVVYLTGTGNDQTVGGNTYKAASLTATQPKLSRSEPGSEIEITIPFDEDAGIIVSRAWLAAAPESTSTVKIKKIHLGDATLEVITFWIGQIVSVRHDNIAATMTCRALPAMFSKQGPRMNWGTSCNHVLYDSHCGLTQAAFTQTASVSAIASDGVTYTLSGLSGLTDGDLIGGKLLLSGAFAQRMIVAHTGSTVKIQHPCSELFVGATVQVLEGCPHDLDACHHRFNNHLNYGGHPYVPTINPFARGLKNLQLDTSTPRVPVTP